MTREDKFSLCVIVTGVPFIVSILLNLPGQNILAILTGFSIGLRLSSHIVD